MALYIEVVFLIKINSQLKTITMRINWGRGRDRGNFRWLYSGFSLLLNT